MNYQVCWRHKALITELWFARFFKDKEAAEKFYSHMKELNCEAKILTIKGGKCQAQKQAV